MSTGNAEGFAYSEPVRLDKQRLERLPGPIVTYVYSIVRRALNAKDKSKTDHFYTGVIRKNRARRHDIAQHWDMLSFHIQKMITTFIEDTEKFFDKKEEGFTMPKDKVPSVMRPPFYRLRNMSPAVTDVIRFFLEKCQARRTIEKVGSWFGEDSILELWDHVRTWAVYVHLAPMIDKVFAFEDAIVSYDVGTLTQEEQQVAEKIRQMDMKTAHWRRA